MAKPNNPKEWMDEGQTRCYRVLCTLFGGENHLDRVEPWGNGIEMNTGQCFFATCDFSGLTLAVFLAHEHCVKIDIGPSGPGLIRVALFPRKREGSMFERHPTLDEAIKAIRDNPRYMQE